jgi:hypothetical protein
VKNRLGMHLIFVNGRLTISRTPSFSPCLMAVHKSPAVPAAEQRLEEVYIEGQLA